ncbi:MAG TPA: 6-bladed beta-propeller [Gammaproteobacteria bacterium]|nr:6-bladed beta-propeller [Gammaproteobacteria bacterium]
MTFHSRPLFYICQVVIFLLYCVGAQAADAQKVTAAAPIPYEKMSFLHYLTGADSTRLSMPTDVAVDENSVYVVDGANHRIVVFSLSGKVLYTFGGKGYGQGKLNSPVGLTIHRDKIYVADRENRLIQIFARDGHFIRQFKVLSRGKAIRPIDIAVSKDGREYYVSGNRNHRLMVFSAAGKLLREWGGDGLNPGQFRYPGSVLVLPDSRIAVVDVLNTRVQVFEKDGTFSVQVGEWGVLPGQLFRPKGVAIDANNNFYISDSYMDVIEVYDGKARFKYVLQPENMAYKPITPAGITIDRQGRLYIAEVLKNRVAVFQLQK